MGPQPYTIGLSELATTTHATLGGTDARMVGTGDPEVCGQSPSVPTQYGSLTVGVAVTLGAHTPYSGPGADGTTVTNDINWAPEMQPFVGQRTTITELSGVDDAGCSVVRVVIDGGQYYWRVRDMSF